MLNKEPQNKVFHVHLPVVYNKYRVLEFYSASKAALYSEKPGAGTKAPV